MDSLADQIAEVLAAMDSCVTTYENLARIARDPGADAAWPALARKLRVIDRELAEIERRAAASLVDRAKFRDLYAALDMGVLENVLALEASQARLDEATGALAAAAQARGSIARLLGLGGGPPSRDQGRE